MRRPWRGTTPGTMEEPGPPGVLRPSGAGAVKGRTGVPEQTAEDPRSPRAVAAAAASRGRPAGLAPPHAAQAR